MVFIPEQHYLWDFWLVSPQEWGDVREPYVVYSSDDQIYYMFLSARVNEGLYDGRAVIGLTRSADLLSWEMLPPVSIPGGLH